MSSTGRSLKTGGGRKQKLMGLVDLDKEDDVDPWKTYLGELVDMVDRSDTQLEDDVANILGEFAALYSIELFEEACRLASHRGARKVGVADVKMLAGMKGCSRERRSVATVNAEAQRQALFNQKIYKY